MYKTFDISLYNLKDGYTTDFAKEAESKINSTNSNDTRKHGATSKAGLISRLKYDMHLMSKISCVDHCFKLTDVKYNGDVIVFKFDITNYTPDLNFNFVLLYTKNKLFTPVLVKFVDVKLSENSESIELYINPAFISKEAFDTILKEITCDTKIVVEESK